MFSTIISDSSSRKPSQIKVRLHDSTIDEPSLRGVLVLYLPDFWPKRAVVDSSIQGCFARFVITAQIWQRFESFSSSLRIGNRWKNSIEMRNSAIVCGINQENARHSLHSMDISLKPCFVLDEFEVSPCEFVQQRVEMVDGSVLS
jgi:hypothetical protein